jgi:hypothetical protein
MARLTELVPRQEGALYNESSFLASHFMLPTHLPGGFSSLDADVASPQKGWARIERFAAQDGGLIELVQGTAKDYIVEGYGGKQKSAKAETVIFRGISATLHRYLKPYPGAILAWQEKGIHLSLEGTGVDPSELVKMAQCMVVLRNRPDAETVLQNLEHAPIFTFFEIYTPGFLPHGLAIKQALLADPVEKGNILARTALKGKSGTYHFSASDQRTTRQRLRADYSSPDGRQLRIDQVGQAAEEEFNETSKRDEIKSAGVHGRFVSKRTPLTLKLLKGDTLIILSGNISREDMIKIAQSMKPVR